MVVIVHAALFGLLLLIPVPVAAQQMLTRVIDTGPGLASVTVIPNNFYMIYDTGHWDHDDSVSIKILELIPPSEPVDLLVLSHSDADHLSATDEIFQRRQVLTVLRTGVKRCSCAWREADTAITNAERRGVTNVINTCENQIALGRSFQFGDATVTFLAGINCPSAYNAVQPYSSNCREPNQSTALNAGSIVVRLEYAGKSILFTGDAVGRREGSPQNSASIKTEAELLSRHSQAGLTLNSDVIIAPHHGSDDASSTEFIAAVSPEWVIFPAGSQHRHPRHSTAERYMKQGVSMKRIFRTDRGDNEGRGNNPSSNTDDEWDYEATPNRDVVGDDNIDIIIKADGTLKVDYVKE